jgi:hypothetical protein
MAVDLMKVTAALNAYPWTTGELTSLDGGIARYCAVGLMLRYAGVPQEQIARTSTTGADWSESREVLQREYGIDDDATVTTIIMANDSAETQEQAIERVQAVLAGRLSPAQLMQLLMAETEGGPPAGESPGDAAEREALDDGARSPALL